MFSVLNMLPTLRVDELFRQTKVDYVDNVLVRCAVPTHQKVLWLHITIDQVLAVDILNSCNLFFEGGGGWRVGGGEGHRGVCSKG